MKLLSCIFYAEFLNQSIYCVSFALALHFCTMLFIVMFTLVTNHSCSRKSPSSVCFFKFLKDYAIKEWFASLIGILLGKSRHKNIMVISFIPEECYSSLKCVRIGQSWLINCIFLWILIIDISDRIWLQFNISPGRSGVQSIRESNGTLWLVFLALRCRLPSYSDACAHRSHSYVSQQNQQVIFWLIHYFTY